jgi:hypothetical protein
MTAEEASIVQNVLTEYMKAKAKAAGATIGENILE